MPTEVIRCDATTVSACHEGVEGGRVQFGHSKDDPSRPQINIMAASLDPLGMPLAIHVLSGEQADDGFYIPIIDRVRNGLNKSGLLLVGDCQRSAFASRAHLAGHPPFYLSPWPLTGTTADHMPHGISQGIAKAQAGELEAVVKTHDKGEPVPVAQGYEIERVCQVPDAKRPWQWRERVVVIHSPAHAEQQAPGLEKRLAHAETKIYALTPPRGRGKRPMTEETPLLDAIAKVLKAQRVEGLMTLADVKQTECQTVYVGPGRGSAHRDQRVIEKGRYQITRVTRHDDQIADLKAGLGWKAFATNATPKRLSWADAVLCDRHEYRLERIFNRLKSRLPIAPMFVKPDDPIQGLTALLTLGVRVLTVMAFTLRRSLQKDHAKLPGLHLENRKKGTDKPTAERILKAFSKVTLTLIKAEAGREIGRWLTPLSSVQQDIIQRLGLEPSLYSQLEFHNTRN